MTSDDAISLWWRSFGRPPRVMGLDVARALAVIGMMGAHFAGIDESFALADPSSWAGIVHGYPSLLFALLAGFSVSLMTRRGEIPDDDIAAARLRMLGRGVVIFTIGVLLELLSTPIAIILTLYGALYLVLIPVLRWRTPWLVLSAVVLGLLGPIALALLAPLPEDAMGPLLEFLLRGSYPITVWMFFALTGMALARLPLLRLVTAAWFAVAGAVLLVGAHTLAALPVAHRMLIEDRMLYAAVFDLEPHSGSMLEILAALGMGLLVIGCCLLLAQPLRWVLLPVAALGSMPLSAYTAHVVSYFAMAGPEGRLAAPEIVLWSTVILLVATTLWSILWRRGPLETAAARAGDAVALLANRN
ncbi:heparan-alpha-glucosaminide N-acetyltransferase domain-containing protein [Microbacterium sp. Mu-80]|uniref:Heparan-alpha-glucosaminide N-acetyltransferase domain-containing protein n=1 Tax=Microbacterium bandirmense TaxID=3122050 RepID=A0ABU8LBE0_9MICO